MGRSGSDGSLTPLFSRLTHNPCGWGLESNPYLILLHGLCVRKDLFPEFDVIRVDGAGFSFLSGMG